MDKKVEVEIGIKDRFSKEYTDIREKIGKSGELLDSLKQKAAELTEKFASSVAEANRLREELKQAAESGAGLDELISKMEALEESESTASDAGKAAMSAQTLYVKALQTAYGDMSSEVKEAARENMELFRTTGEMGQRAEQTSQTLSKYQEKLEKTSESTKKLSEESEKASKASESLADDISKVPGPLGETARGMKALTKETLVFLATPLGMVLAAISAGLALVSSWFHRTEEGEETLNVATARFTGTLNTLLDVADDVGEWLYKAFTSPKEAISELWHSLKDKVLADMKRVAEMGAGIVKIFSGDVGGGMAQAWSAWNGIGLGGLKERARQNSDKQADLARRQNALDREQRKWIVEREEKEARISELRAKIYDSTAKESEKAKAIKEAKKLTNELYDKEVSMAKEQHAIIAETNNLSHSSISDKKKEQEALAQTIRLERQRNDALRMLNRNESSLSNKASSSARKDQKRSEDEAQRRQKLYELEQKAEQEAAAQTESTIKAVNAAKIATIENAEERTRAQQDEQHRLNLEAIDRREEEMKKKLYEFNKSVWEAKNQGSGQSYSDTEEGKAGYVNLQLAKEQMDELQALRLKENAEYKRLVQKRYEDEAHAMLDYLKEYGSVEQQKYAIAHEYDEKIANERSEWRRKSLEEEKNTKMAALDAQSLAQSIDWTQTFSGIGNILEEIAKETMKEVEEYMQTTEFKALGAEAKKAYADLRNELAEAGGVKISNPFKKETWDEIGRLANEYRDSVKNVKLATETHSDAVRKVSEAEKAVAEATTVQQQYIAGMDLEAAKKWADETKQALENEQKRKDETGTQLRQNTEAAAKGLQNFDTVLGQITSGTLTGFVLAVGNLIRLIGDSSKEAATNIGGLFGDAGKQIGGIIGAILSIIDALGDDPAAFIDQILDKVATVIEAVLEQIPQIIGSVVSGVGNIVGGVVNGIAGLFGLDLFGKSNHEEQLEVQEKLNKGIESTTKALAKMTGQLEKSFGSLAIQNQKNAELLIRQNMQAIMNGIDSVLSDNYEGGHSDYYHLNKNQSLLSQIQSYGDMFGINANEGGKYTWQQLLSNNTESLAQLFKYIQEQDSELWRMITQESGYNEGALEEWLQKLIDTYDQIADSQEQLNQQLTTTTADNVFNDFLSSLYDLADGSETVMDEMAENWQRMVNRMVVNNLIGGRMREELEKWYQDLADLNERRSGGMSNEDYRRELEALQTVYNNLIESGRSQIEQFTKDGIIKPIEDTTEEVSDLFDGIRSAWQSALTGMKFDADDFGKEIADIMFEHLVSSMLFNDEFDEWLKDWTKRYEEIFSIQAPGEREARLAQLNEERTNKFREMAETTKKIAEDVGHVGEDAVEEFSNSIDNLSDALIDSLLDMDADAGDIGKKIGSTLIREMLGQMLASEAYAGRIADIKEHWQKALSGEDGFSYESVMGEIAALNNDIANDDAIGQLADQWKALNAQVKGTDSVFKNLRSTFLDTLTDMSGDAESFRKELEKTMVKDVIDKQVLGRAFSFGGSDYSGMDDFVEKWNKRYTEALESGNQEAIDALLDELVQVRDLTVEAAAELRERLKEAEENVPDTTFKDMKDDFVSVLMDMDATADEWGQKIGGTIARRIIEQFLVTDQIQPVLNDLQTAFDTAMSADGATSESVIAALAPEIETAKEKFNDLKPVIDGILAALGITKEPELPFSNIRDEFVSSLLDMEEDAEKFGNRIAQGLLKEMLAQLVDKEFAEDMKAVRELWGRYLNGDEGVTWQSVMNEIVALDKKMAESDGISELTKAFNSLNEETEKSDETFKGMGDSFTSMLLDIDKSAADFGREIGQTLAQKIIKELVVNKELQAYLDDIRQAYDEAIAADGATIDSVLAAVTPKIDAAIAAMERWKPATDEIARRFREIDSSTPFDGLRSSFLSSLMDMEAKTGDFADSIANILTEAFVDTFVLGDEFDSLLEGWKKRYTEIIGDKGMTTEQRTKALNDLKVVIADTRESLAQEARAIQDLMGTNTREDQSAYMNTAEKITYDQADIIAGMTTSLVMGQLQGNEVREQILATLKAMNGLTEAGDTSYGEKIFSRLGTTNEYLLAIKNEVVGTLSAIKNYTSNLTKL